MLWGVNIENEFENKLQYTGVSLSGQNGPIISINKHS